MFLFDRSGRGIWRGCPMLWAPFGLMAPKGVPCQVKLLNSCCLGRGWELLIYCPPPASPTPSTVTQCLASKMWQQLPKHSQCKEMWYCSLNPNWRTVSPQKTKPSFLPVKTIANLQLTSKALGLGGSNSQSSENGKVSWCGTVFGSEMKIRPH